MNLLKRSSPLPRQGQQQSPLYGGRLTPSPHYPHQGTTPGSPLTSTHRTPGVTSLLLQMGGENSAFKSLVPTSSFGHSLNISGGYSSNSDEEINVNDESDVEETVSKRIENLREDCRSKSCSPVDVIEDSQKENSNGGCQPLQLTKHDRD